MPTSKKAKNMLESYKEKIRREYYGGGKDLKLERKTLPGSLSTLLFHERLLPIKSQISEKVSSNQSKKSKIKQQIPKFNNENGKKESYKDKTRKEYYGVGGIAEKDDKLTRNVCECEQEEKCKKDKGKKQSYKEKIRGEYYGVGIAEKNDKSTRNVSEYELEEEGKQEKGKKESYKEKIRQEYYGVSTVEKSYKTTKNVNQYEQKEKGKKEKGKKESYKEKIRREYYGDSAVEKNYKTTRNVSECEQKEKAKKEKSKKESYKEKIRREYYKISTVEKNYKTTRNVSEYGQAYQQMRGQSPESRRVLQETTIMPVSLSTVTQGRTDTKIEQWQSPVMLSEQVQVPEVFHESLPVQPRVRLKSKKDWELEKKLEKMVKKEKEREAKWEKKEREQEAKWEKKEKEREAKQTEKTPRVKLVEKKQQQLSGTTSLPDSMSTLLAKNNSGCSGKQKKASHS
ncbi:golgin subfamily A member 6-like protein 22 [Chrysoperla carnea]|uniref:golgin subfamily A member 6-like protein 22 n=1 Tax=Chrysoperla carnea TaxID=189513 RepID=UPI001D07A5E9|nr:golgin subfamily A member 6-like protein 22 [Chrysoperla carnea]